LWVRPLWSFGFWFHLAAGVVILGAGLCLPEKLNEGFLKVFGLTSCLYVIPDIYSDTIARSGLVSDARMLAEITHIPTVLWGGAWIVAAVVIAFVCLRAACRRGRVSP
jgi:Peptidase M50B-like